MSFSTRSRGPAGALALTLLAALACSKSSPTPPTDFGVNITVDASALSASQRSMVKVGSLLVSGAESLSKQFDVSSAISSGKLTFQFVPTQATSGSLSFEFDAIDATGVMWGSGTGGPVALNPTGAVAVTIPLVAKPGTLKAPAAKCTTATECASGFCTDGVCCLAACKDTCASCALTTTLGICTGYPDGTDPENECAGSSMTGAGGAAGRAGGGGAGGKAGTSGAAGAAGAAGAGGAKSDAGTARDASSDAEEINPPDGGIVAMPATCGGKCNGMKACASFAQPGTSCGTPFCNTHRDVASPICDGKGTCGISLANCTGGYACDEVAKPTPACHTNCNSNNDCTVGFYCNGTTSMCAPVKVDSLTCATDAECLHNHCVTGVCCNTACASPFTCNDSGSAGTCKCPGVATCATGVSCAVFYPDADGDGYGDKTASLATNTAKAACADSTQTGFVLDNTDCDDHDANAHPGQTSFFATASNGTKTFDYDCDGTLEKGLPEYPGASCTFCGSCSSCGPGSTMCAASGAQASLACKVEGGICLQTLEKEPGASLQMSVLPAAAVGTSPPIVIRIACCGCDDYTGFTSTVNCGVAAPLYTCGTCSAMNGTVTGTTSASTKQTCH